MKKASIFMSYLIKSNLVELKNDLTNDFKFKTILKAICENSILFQEPFSRISFIFTIQKSSRGIKI